VAVAAVQGLQISGSANAILQLCPMLQADRPVLIETAKNALLTLGPQYILNAFADLPTNPDERVRDGGVFVLQRMGPHPKVFELLTAMLHDRSERVRKKVILAMAFQKNPAFLTILREYYRDTSDDEEKKLVRKAMIHLQAFAPKPTVSGRP